MLLAYDLGGEDGRRRSQWVHSWVDAQSGDVTAQLGGAVEVGERREWCRVGVVIGGHVHGLHRCDRPTTGRGDPLLQVTHLIGQRRLVAHGRRHASQQGRNFRTGLHETEDVVNEEQHILTLLVTEVLSHGQGRQGDAQAHPGRLIHLAEHQGRLLEYA